MTKQSTIGELKNLGFEDACTRVRIRVIEMYERIGSPEDAIKWMWKDLVVFQSGEAF